MTTTAGTPDPGPGDDAKETESTTGGREVRGVEIGMTEDGSSFEPEEDRGGDEDSAT